jgi:rhamnosyltransferase subunit B
MTRVVLCTFGSLGDLHPILALGRELRRRGMSSVVATSPAYRAKVEAAGIEFHPIGPDIKIDDPAILRRAMHPRDGTRYIFSELVMPYLRDSYQETEAAARHADLIVTHPATLGAYLYARRSGMPWASLALAPVSMLSVHDMCVFPGFPAREWLARRGPRTQRLFLRLLETLLESSWKPYRALERDLGLQRDRNPIMFGHSPQLALALFSPILASPQPDWPPSAHATGFPFFDQEETISPDLQRFLELGEPPIVFTLGSAAIGAAGDFFRESVEASRILGRRAILVVGNDPANQPTNDLPAGIIAVPYVPHAAVFPRACVNVHQGGIGTTAEAMRAGRPMLVVPYSHDQPDHACRLKKLGIARIVRREEYNAKRAAREISELLRDPAYSDRAAEVGELVCLEQGVKTACDLLQGLVRKGKDLVAPVESSIGG